MGIDLGPLFASPPAQHVFKGDPTGRWRSCRAQPTSQRRDGRHLDQQRLLHEAVDDQQRVGWIAPARKHARKFAQPKLHEFRDVLGMHEIGRELDHIAEVRTLRFQRGLDVGENLPVKWRPTAAASSWAVATWPAMNRNSDALTRVI